MKKLGYIMLMIVVLLPMFLFPINVQASKKTLKDLYDELTKLENELKQVNEDKTLTEERIKEIKQNINSIDREVIVIEKTIVEIQNEIVKLNEDIIAKDKEMKELVRFYQLSTGENMYLEFAFGASSMTDFIYRLAVVEQLMKHTDQLITDMHNMIATQEKKSKELAIHQENLAVKKKQLFEEQFKLGDRVRELQHGVLSLSQEIADAKTTIKNYEKIGCKPNDYLEDCTRVNGDIMFARPVKRGRITCDWMCYTNHRAVDIGGGIFGEPIYAAAAGRVVLIEWGSSCGGNYLVIQHLVNGQYYATRYMHMQTINVSLNQEVTRDTVIGTVGGATGGVDQCTTGPHLHFQVAEGIYGKDIRSFSDQAKNPRYYVNFPAGDGWFYDRYTKY